MSIVVYTTYAKKAYADTTARTGTVVDQRMGDAIPKHTKKVYLFS